MRTFLLGLVALFLATAASAASSVIPLYAPSNDVTGATDARVLNALLSSSSVQLQCGAIYYVNTTITVSAQGVSFNGCGQNTVISGVGVSGPIVLVSGTTVDVGRFQIYGTGTNALKCYGGNGGSRIHDISVDSGGSWVDVFWFGICFGNQIDNLSIFGVPGSSSDFHFDGAVNADVFNNLFTASSYTTGANFRFQNDGGYGNSTGNTFNDLTAEGGTTGFYFGGGFQDNTLNSNYCEAVVHCMVFGDATNQSRALTINSPFLGGPDPTFNASNGYSSRQALIDFYNASGITINSPALEGSYLVDVIAQVAFSGGGCTNEPSGIARVNPSGVVTSVMLLYTGSGCTGTPAVAINAGTSGSGATASATCCTSGSVTALTLGAGGSGYGPNPPPMPITFNSCAGITINTPYFNAGLHQALFPWIVKHSTANTPSGITIIDDQAGVLLTPSSGQTASANLNLVPSFSNLHYLTYLNGSGTTVLTPVTPPNYP